MKSYLRIVLLNFLLITFVRLFEAVLAWHYHHPSQLFYSEFLGWLNDLGPCSALLLVLFPVYLLICRLSSAFANGLFISISTLFYTLHILILKYFLYQLEPLDIFLYQTPMREIMQTVKTSGDNFILSFIYVLLPGLISFFYLRYFRIYSISKRTRIAIPATMLLFIFMHLTITHTLATGANERLYTNKSSYFYKRSLAFLFEKPDAGVAAAREYQKVFPGRDYISSQYPFLHHTEYKDVLGKYFNKDTASPNIVVLIVEGMAGRFIHPIRGVNFMPFMDSLSQQSLYWDKFFTDGERSFAVVPSLTGSLPYGEKGFTLMEKMPYHFSLVNVLKRNNYFTSFYYGQGAWFHRKDYYFGQNNIDLIMDNHKYDPDFKKIIVGSFFWGYNDHDLFTQYLRTTDTLQNRRRLDIFFTGSSHSPFEIPDADHYQQLLEERISHCSAEDQEYFNTYGKYYRSLLFVNDAIRYLVSEYKKRPEFKHTVFIITGDHPMSEIPIENSLKRYHVPLIIYSPLLKEHKTFHGSSSHLDIYESLLGFLHRNYGTKVPAVSAALGSYLDTSTCTYNFKNKNIAFMNTNRVVIDYFSDGYYLASDNRLYKTDKDFNITPTDNKPMQEELFRKLSTFRNASLYASRNWKIIPDTSYFKFLGGKVFAGLVKPDSVTSSEEYNVVIPKVKIGDKPLYFDLALDLPDGADPSIAGVCQLTDSTGKPAFWQSFGFPQDSHVAQFHIKVPVTSVTSHLYFSAYIWDQKKIKYSIANLRSAVFEQY